jgi:hypothetical protein
MVNSGLKMNDYRTGLLDQYRSRFGAQVSVGASLKVPQPPAPRWVWAHDHAFDVTPALQSGLPIEQRGERWHSGHVEALYPIDRSVLVGADNGGVWLVNPAFDAIPAAESFPATPVSMSWANTYVRSLMALPGDTPPRVVFVGLDEVELPYLVAIGLRPVLGGVEVSGTRIISPPPARGIWSLLFVDETTLLAGTGDGVWWTVVDDDPLSSWVPSWRHASSVWGRVTSLALGPDRSVIAGAQGYPGPAGIWHGMWSATSSPQLDFTQPMPTMGRTSVASCESNRSVAYAVAAISDGNLGGTWRSGDGGRSWSAIAKPQNAGTQGNNWNNCIAVHPGDPNTVAVGWRTGPLFLDNAAGTWERRTDEGGEPTGHMHADVHTLVFRQTETELQLWAGTDGGVCLSLDLGKTWDSRYNRHLLTAQVYSTLAHTLEEYGLGASQLYERDNSSFHVSAASPGLFGVATQDDGTLISRESPGGHRSLWPANGGDGQAILFAGDDLVFHTDNTANRLRMSRRLATGVLDDGGTVVPVDGNPAGLPKLALGATHRPNHRLNGRLVLGIAGGSTNVLALLEPASPTTAADLKTVASVQQVISAVASLDGKTALVGTVDGHLYSVDVEVGTVTNETVASNAPGPVKRLRWRGPNHALAVFGNDRIFRRTANGWTALPGPPVPVFDVDGDPEIADGALFAASGEGVFGSIDGMTWVACSDGLPKWPNGRAIQLTSAGGEPTAYYATYGWGVFRADLATDATAEIPQIDDEMVKIVFGIIQDGGGVEIVGKGIRRVPPRGPARALAIAIGLNILASRFDGEKEIVSELTAQSSELTRSLALLAQEQDRQTTT